jgi:3',5'-cyclic AMP phosphodiesterase CpdA
LSRAAGRPVAELTTVADDLVVFHEGDRVHRYDGLTPDTEYRFHGTTVRTLPRPTGELLARVATVNDVHFGETECGRIDDRTDGPIVRPEPGDDPYPEVMNRAAVEEIRAIEPDVVVVKGDLSSEGTDEEWAAFEACYRPAFGDRLQVVRGNHDAYHGQTRYAGDRWIEVPGLSVGLLDTTIPTRTTGGLLPRQLDELEQHVSASEVPVLLMGHHQQWVSHVGDGARRDDDYFGLHPDASDALDRLCLRNRCVIGYTAGHTHRHRVRRMTASGVPSVEIGCVKDFPGTWAEYRVHEGGVMQVVHRISSPAALSWSNRCRALYSDFGIDYERYALGTLDDRCFVFPERAE